MALLSWFLALFCIYTYTRSPSDTILAEDLANDYVKDTIHPSETLKDGQTLVSSNKQFELGFFNPSKHKNKRYLGIWYFNISVPTVVWVANTRETLQSSKARLQLESNGALALYDHRNSPIFIYNPTRNASKPFLQIRYTGNLIVGDGDGDGDGSTRLWQSFDNPTDTLLPRMRIGWTYNPPRSIVLTSWKSANDPSPGDFTLGLDNLELPQLVLEKKSTKLSRWGPWEGVRFSGFGIGNEQIFYTPLYVFQSEVCFGFDVWHEDALVRLQMTHFGKIQVSIWNCTAKSWIQLMTSNKNFCDNYNACGPYEICHNEEPHCRCLEGFDPNNSRDRVSGCTRKIRRKCDAGDNFVKFTGLNLPDNAVVWPDLNASQCEKKCLEECKCNAYSYFYQNGTKCVVWLGDLVDLVDVGDIPKIWGELHIRMAQDKPENFTKAWVPPPKNNKKKNKKNLIVIVAVSSICVLVLSVLLFTCWSRMRNTRRLDRQRSQQRNWSSNEDDNFDFRLYEVETISVATNDFSDDNKIGEGGFGPVYKGVLHNGREIAVKRLSSSSRQGQEQFENESGLIARLQHRNLVKLLGCCVHDEERMVVYEYLANQSLDKFIFDQAKRVLLTWDTRLEIILGVAKGLVYLHDDSGLTIVHRDLKASNILLDSEMIPKISDFGLAKILGDDNESTERALKVHGTYGYLSPEYAMHGQFSTKSDVFSFGVLVLEIISGKKNWGFRHPDHDMNLLGHAWNLWREGNALEMIDPALGDLSFGTEILRCIQVGLLCAQHNPEHRPTMSIVVFMLMNETRALPEPTVPGFFPEDSLLGGTSGFIRPLSVSFNGLTVTTLNAR